MLLYRFVDIWARITMFFFFRKIKVTGKENIPKGPVSVIFAPNHQSAFLDPIVVVLNCGKEPWFLTRASVFKGNFVKKLLKTMHLIPVFRPRDMVDMKTANNQTFEFCHEALMKGEDLMIFPEGNHGMQKRLRTPLKKGIGRIAYRAAMAMQNNPEKDVMIVPVGINYDHPTGMRTDLLLQFGAPLSMKAYLANEHSEVAVLKVLREDLAKGLQDLMIDIRPKERYDELEKAWQQQREYLPSLPERFSNDKKIIAALSASETLPSTPTKKRPRGVLHTILLVLGFPFWLLGLLLNIPFILGSRYLLDKVVSDTHFLQSIKFICIMVGVPLFTLITAGILHAFTGSFWIFVALIPFLGLLAYEYQTRILKTPALILTKDLAGEFLPED
ncbi:1-acyl-sn-glycerol-3-phosphate acyltransferase [Robertkochia sediminum]|uniref:1-acyl-sn-glycerol-3-phosphate acyltransferase n=1 Tax=Robertkochia sediminum TaxID=2785326 RepID=UPI001932D569|nr:1-acyl-sn-glycerol-3-phosphate acyltransferase [Robertkochia sediminum]MBL7471201.1 1-acyl-sn-glycerol-3-phosphate acyltransferase [Robertkochia sediminum]